MLGWRLKEKKVKKVKKTMKIMMQQVVMKITNPTKSIYKKLPLMLKNETEMKKK